MNSGDLRGWTDLVLAVGVVITALTSLVAAVLGAVGRRKIIAQNDRAEAKIDAVHGLVNGQMNHVLKQNAELAEKVAEVSGTEEDRTIAKEARVMSDDHVICAAAVSSLKPEVSSKTVVVDVKKGSALASQVVSKELK